MRTEEEVIDKYKNKYEKSFGEGFFYINPDDEILAMEKYASQFLPQQQMKWPTKSEVIEYIEKEMGWNVDGATETNDMLLLYEWLESRLSLTSISQPKWISLTERLPYPGQKVDLWLLALDDEKKSHRISWTWENESTAEITISGCKVTHWMPFEAPKA